MTTSIRSWRARRGIRIRIVTTRSSTRTRTGRTCITGTVTTEGGSGAEWFLPVRIGDAGGRWRAGAYAGGLSLLAVPQGFWNPTIDGYEWTAVAMGAFDSPTGVRLAKHTFVGDKGDYYDIDDGLPQSLDY